MNPTPATIAHSVSKDHSTSAEESDSNGPELKHLFEQSTQYRFWRYTPDQLQSIRQKANEETVSTIKAHSSEEREMCKAQDLPEPASFEDFQFLTVDEETALVGFYERKIVQICRSWKLPPYVGATAIVYMKRFYLENTVMDFHPKEVMLACIFLARKTEHFLMTTEDFSKALKLDRNSMQDILDLEFPICQNLKFHFTVHHPYRACLGFFFDMQTSPAAAEKNTMERLQKTYEVALKLIDTSLFTDLCFHYQPAQIALAIMKIAAAEEGFNFEKYETYKFKASDETAQKYNEILHPILLDIARVLKTDSRVVEVEKSVLQGIDRRLKLCKDPIRNPNSQIYRKYRAASNDDDDDDDDDDGFGSFGNNGGGAGGPTNQQSQMTPAEKRIKLDNSAESSFSNSAVSTLPNTPAL